jgi:RimJ/RimL family protein N-acetyltransferase
MNVREAVPGDAANLVAFFRTLYSETRFMLFEPDEFAVTEEQQRRRIEEMSRQGSGVLLLIEDQVLPIGVVFGNRGIARRTRHSLYVVIGVLEAWHGRGVGRSLMQALESWAQVQGIHRLELVVDVGNQRAIALYERCGFEREGVKRDSRFVDGRYADELFMSKLIDPVVPEARLEPARP